MFGRTGLAALAAAVLTAGPAPAIVINDDFGPEGAEALGAPFLNVVRLDFTDGSGPFCTGSLISMTAILTARHCTDGLFPDEITVSFTEGTGEIILSRQVHGISSLIGGFDYEAGDYDGSDLSVLSLWEAVTGIAPFRLLANPMVGEIARMVGFGAQGLGSTGAALEGVGRWAADNVVDAILRFDPDTRIFTDFDDPTGQFNFVAEDFPDIFDLAAGIVSSPEMLPTEGTTASGDSGGPLLFRRGDEWVIGGVLSGGFGDGYGDVSHWNGVTSGAARGLLDDFGAVYYPEVDLTPIPLPASGLLLLAGLGALALRRRAA